MKVGDNRAAEMAAFRERLAGYGLQPLWDIMRRLAAREPAKGGDPIRWRWDDLRALALRSGELISAEEAERRVLVLENPAFPGEGRVTSSLYAGVQLLMPGEVAPGHRHTASAVRFILEGSGGYTSVAGERAAMTPGDFIVTPSWSVHDHGNDGDRPVLWLDGLDVFVVNLFNAPFAEDVSGDEAQEPTREEPTFCWPYAERRSALAARLDGGDIDPALGVRLDYRDPVTGRSPVRTMTASLSLFPAGFRGASYRSTAGAVWSLVEGSGRVRIGTETFELAPRDIVVVPGWTWHAIEADEEMVLFGFSDEELQRHLGFWREQREDKETA